MSRLSIAQAAKLLEVPESTIRHARRVGNLTALEQRGIGGQLQFDVAEVRRFGRQRKFGQYDRAFRHVAVAWMGPENDAVIALRAAGLHVELGNSVMAAISTHHDRTGGTILVAPVRMPEQEINLLRAVGRDLHLVLVGDARLVDTAIEKFALVCDPFELRRLVQIVWGLVEKRDK